MYLWVKNDHHSIEKISSGWLKTYTWGGGLVILWGENILHKHSRVESEVLRKNSRGVSVIYKCLKSAKNSYKHHYTHFRPYLLCHFWGIGDFVQKF